MALTLAENLIDDGGRDERDLMARFVRIRWNLTPDRDR